jgi:hypothetical protein
MIMQTYDHEKYNRLWVWSIWKFTKYNFQNNSTHKHEINMKDTQNSKKYPNEISIINMKIFSFTWNGWTLSVGHVLEIFHFGEILISKPSTLM